MKVTLSLVCVCTLAAFLMTGCRKASSELDVVRPVHATKVGDLRAFHGRVFPGRAKAKYEVDLSFRVSGPLVSLLVDVGSQVREGDVIAVIDPRDFQEALDSAQGQLGVARANLLAMERGARPEEIEQLRASLAQAEASYRQALADHERFEKLLPSRAVSQAQFDAALAQRDLTAAQVRKAREALSIGLKGARSEDLEAKRSEIQSLEAAVQNAKNQLDYTVLKAPFDGDVASRYVDNFQTVQAKQPIVRLLDLSKIEVTVQVPESLIALAPRVKKVTCRFDAFPEHEFVGEVTKIGTEASQTTRTYPVTVALDQPEGVRILPGMASTIRVDPLDDDTEVENDLIVPPGAVFSPGTESTGRQTFVWVIDEESHTASRRAVTTGEFTPTGVVILEGLRPGEWVATTGVHSLYEGQRVRIQQEGSR